MFIVHPFMTSNGTNKSGSNRGELKAYYFW